MVAEKESEPGGLCRTLNFHDYLFDIGGHRFLSNSPEINRLWSEVMGPDMLRVKRLSRIYYKKKFFSYPLAFFNTFWNFGPFESLWCIGSYLKARMLNPGDEKTFEGWITNHFGKRLYEIFFRTYTEKVWAVPCRDISADWAKERIKGLSLQVAIRNAVMKLKGNAPKTLTEEFLYPVKGPGEFYRRFKDKVFQNGGTFHFNQRVTRVGHSLGKIVCVEIEDVRTGETRILEVDALFSSLPLPELMAMMDPLPSRELMEEARKLWFRNFLVVNVILDKEDVFPDQWIYVHSPEVALGRIQNYKNWSSRMVADSRKTSLGLEYFCSEDDSLWSMNDIDLIHLAVSELEKIGIVSRRHLIDGFVVRQSHVYPVYSLGYEASVRVLKSYLRGFSNLEMMGRAGLFRYDNSDQALLSGMDAARNFLNGRDRDFSEALAGEVFKS